MVLERHVGKRCWNTAEVHIPVLLDSVASEHWWRKDGRQARLAPVLSCENAPLLYILVFFIFS